MYKENNLSFSQMVACEKIKTSIHALEIFVS